MKRLWLTLLLIWILTGVAWAAILIDGTPDAFTEAAADTQHTSASFTIANLPGGLLVVPFAAAGVMSVTSVTHGVELDPLLVVTGATATAGAGSVDADAYYRIAPDAEAGTVVTTISPSQRLLQMPISLYNVIDASPIRDGDGEAGETQTITADLTLTTVVGDMVISCVAVRRAAGADPGALTPDSGTPLEQLNNTLGTRYSCSYQTAVGATTTVGWDWPGPNAGWAHIAFSVIPAVSGTPVHYYRQMTQQ